MSKRKIIKLLAQAVANPMVKVIEALIKLLDFVRDVLVQLANRLDSQRPREITVEYVIQEKTNYASFVFPKPPPEFFDEIIHALRREQARRTGQHHDRHSGIGKVDRSDQAGG